MIHFRLLGIPVTVQPWHWVLLAVIGGAFSIKDSSDFLNVGLFVLAGFLSVLVHEFGHALTGRKFGGNPQIILHGMGGVAIFPQARFTRKQSFLMVAAGPGIQLALGLLALLIYKSGGLPPTQIKLFIYFLCLVSFFWAILNLIPVLPLDGGQLLHAVMGPKKITITLQISILASILGAVAGVLFLRSLIIPIFFLYLAYKNYQGLKPPASDHR